MAFTIGTATFTNGSKDVSGVSLTSGKTSYFDTGTRMVVSSNPVIAEVEAVSAPSVNSIRLAENWPHATGTYPFLANMTAEGVVGLAERIRDYIGRVQGETAALVKLYDNTADGIAGTVAGEYFNVLVPSDPDVYSELYLNSNGTAVFQVSMPTKAALDAATQAAQLSESNAATSEQNAAASETKSQEWAENPEDVAVEAGQYSALHWSAKSQGFSTNSADSATLSEKWASEAENIEVEPGLYSALHWAAKAEGFATSINPTVAPTPDTAVQRTNTGAVRVANAVNADEAVALGQTGTAYSKDVGESSGNVMEVGAFGLGSKDLPPQQGLDLNTLITLGWNYVAGPVNGRVTTTSFIFTLPSLAGSGRTRQWQYPVLGDTVYYRYQNAGVWQPWIKSYDEANILGTVSQSGGVPTGAIIERGSNSNGEYVKYADGTLICWVEFSIIGDSYPSAYGDFWRSGTEDVSFPISFINTGFRVAFSMHLQSSISITENSVARTTSGVGLIAISNSLASGSGDWGAEIIAIGRWY